MNAWVYIKTEPCLWTVGTYDGEGKWQPESDFNDPDQAAARVRYLNGGPTPEREQLSDREVMLLDALRSIVTQPMGHTAVDAGRDCAAMCRIAAKAIAKATGGENED